MTQYTVPDSVPYPDNNDWSPTDPGNLPWEYGVAEVRELTEASALALQVALTKRAAEAATAKTDAIADATAKYGTLPARMTSTESTVASQGTQINTVTADLPPIKNDIADLKVLGGINPGSVNDTTAANLIETEGTETHTAAKAVLVPRKSPTHPVNAMDYGNFPTLSTLQFALDAAEARGKHVPVYIGSQKWDVGNGLIMAGRSALLQGDGAGGVAGGPRGSLIHASTQNGPVVDFTDWVVPSSETGELFTGKVSIGGFAVSGSGVADPTKNNAGVRLKRMSSATFHDITVANTGGPAWEHVESPGNAVYLNDFERITLTTPIDAAANNVPYMIMNESNGNRFRSIGFRSPAPAGAVASVGISGALVIKGNGSFAAYDNLFDGCWFEYLVLPTGGCLIDAAMNMSHFHQTGWHDTFKQVGATGTAYMRLRAPAVQDLGGNTVDGIIPGNYPSSNGVDAGIEVFQSGNKISGVRGFQGNNVILQPGVLRTYVELMGSVSSPVGVGVTDNSGSVGNASNIIVEMATGGRMTVNRMNIGNVLTGLATVASLASPTGEMPVYTDMRLFNPAGTAPGKINFGPGGGPSVQSGTGDPNGAVAAGVGSIYLRSGGGAGTAFYIKETGSGLTGWVAK